MATRTESDKSAAAESKPASLGRWIAIGLLLGLICGVFFGEYCAGLELIGNAYVGLLQMTVLPYLVLSLVAQMGRLDVDRARKLGFTALAVLLVLWLIAGFLIVCVSAILPPVQGASFYSPVAEAGDGGLDLLSRLIPTNVFHSLSNEYVPAVVVFCLFFGCALMLVDGKEKLLDFLDLCSAGISRINVFLVRLAPIGLFALSAAAAGTLRLEELSRLQAYLLMFTLACVVAAFAALPMLLTSLTTISYRDLLREAQEPMLTAIATGKLFVVLPQIVDKCEKLLRDNDQGSEEPDSAPAETDPASAEFESTAGVLVPLAYPFPHIGKILAFVFISFAAWYSGRALAPHETTVLAATGVVSSFASPLVSVPSLLDQYHLPQDLMALFILPGFITMRLADVVGVMHLMVLTLIVTQVTRRRARIRWARLLGSGAAIIICLIIAGVTCRLYLASTTLKYDLDQRLLALEISSPHEDVVVHTRPDDVPQAPPVDGSTIDRVKTERVLRVGYHPNHLPYSFFNAKQQLVGLDVELMHRLATRLQVRLEFVPFSYDTDVQQLETGAIDMVIGGVIIKPERLLIAGFTQAYETATLAVVLPDHRRGEFDSWDDPQMPDDLRMGVISEDDAIAGRRQLPDVEFTVVESIDAFFKGKLNELDGLVLPAEEAAAWNVLYPEYAVVVPEPVVRRPIGMAVRSSDSQWLLFLDRWLDFERMDGSLDRLRKYWVQGGGTKKVAPRWCVIRDVLHWVP